MVVANATGCSSIYGGNQPTTPWAKNKEGRGPAWANSLFEDNAEFGLGMRLAITKHAKQALSLLEAVNVPAELKEKLTTQEQNDEAGLNDRTSQMQKKTPIDLCSRLRRQLDSCRLRLTKAQRENVNICVLDTEVYSNTGGQASKATNRGAVALFAAAGKRAGKKDLGLIAMSYKNV